MGSMLSVRRPMPVITEWHPEIFLKNPSLFNNCLEIHLQMGGGVICTNVKKRQDNKKLNSFTKLN